MSQTAVVSAPVESRPEKRSIPYVPAHPSAYAYWKRVFDVFFASLFIIATLPVWIAVMLAIRLTDKGPIFYKSKRVGLSGEIFYITKFRSMYVDADKRHMELVKQNDCDGPCFKMKNDPRVTPIGRFLRKYSLDELPQFLDVLKGTLSIVGPRPVLPHEVEEMDDFAMARHAVKPGITCYWQIMGRSNLTFEEWMRLDHRYMQEVSFITDLKIVVKTPKSILFSDGAY